MKKLLLLASTFAVSASLFAQKGFEIGVQAQPQNTWIFNSDDFAAGPDLNFETTFKFAYGLNLGYNFTDQIGVRTGVLMSRQGQHYITDETTPQEFQTNFRYLKIPVLLKYNGSLEHSVPFLLEVGPQFGLLQKATRTLPTNTSFTGKQVNDVAGLYKGSDIAIVLGIGTQIPIATAVNANVGLRFDYSLTDIEDETYKNTEFLVENAGVGRKSANNLTAGLKIGINYVIGAQE
jgi:hypothetical protein